MSAVAFAGRPVLVTGAHGFVGSALTRALLDAGARVLAPRRPGRGRPDPRAEEVALDVLDLGSIARVLREHRAEAVFHLAAQTVAGAAEGAPGAAFDVNVRGTYHVLEACREHGAAAGPHLVVASSYLAYGPSPGGAPSTEADDLRPVAPYDVSKACADAIAQSYAAAYGLPLAVVRLASVYGPGDASASRVVPGAARALAAGERPVIRSDGTPERDLLHVDDAVAALLAAGAALAEPAHRGRVWNAGSGRAVSVLELVRGLARAAGRDDLEPEVLGTPDPGAPVDRRVLDASALRAALGWRPRRALEDGLRETAAWHAERHAAGAGGRALDRRGFLAAAAAAGACGWALARPVRPAAARSAGLGKLVDLGAGGTIRPGSPGDLRFPGVRARLAAAGATHVRLWADWPTLQPDPARAVDDPASPGAAHLAALDAQVAAAHADGLAVVLVAYRFPPWANGTEALAARRGTDAEVAFAAPDRMTAAGWERYVREGRDPARHAPSRRALELRIPADLGPGGAWAGFVAFLLGRYAPRIAALELTNEPNFQWWPQRGPAPAGGDPFALGPLTAPARFAEAMHTAQRVAERLGHATLLLGPATADSLVGGRLVTDAEAFTAALLDALALRRFAAGPELVWSHHDYTDLEHRREATVTQRVRALLAGRWTGRAADGGPAVWITEGGVRLSAMRARYPREDPLDAQAASWRLAWARHDRADGAGAGVELLAQYTLHAEPGFDCGLLDPWPSSRERPAWHAWASFGRAGRAGAPGR